MANPSLSLATRPWKSRNFHNGVFTALVLLLALVASPVSARRGFSMSRMAPAVTTVTTPLTTSSSSSSAAAVSLVSATTAAAPSSSSVVAPPSLPNVAKGGNTNKKKKNPVGQLVGYVKSSVVRTVDGCQELWANHGRCNEIRKKQKIYKDAINTDEWMTEETATGGGGGSALGAPQPLTKVQIKERLRAIQGGITYADYAFLQKGKEDRGKVLNMVFLMWGAPRFLPYALMFNPDMLPSPFSNTNNGGKGAMAESKQQKLSRERSAAVITTLVNMEKTAVTSGPMAKINIFGGKKRAAQQLELLNLGDSVGTLLQQQQPVLQGGTGAATCLNHLEPLLYSKQEFSRGDKRLCQVPGCIIKGLGACIGPTGMFGALAPNFITRGRVLGHIRKVADADDFLMQADIDLNSISKRLLKEACSERLIGGPGRSEDELRQNLHDWLHVVVRQPAVELQARRQSESAAETVDGAAWEYNDNLARMALMSYYSCLSARDARNSSALPRLLFSGGSAASGGKSNKAATSLSSSSASALLKQPASASKSLLDGKDDFTKRTFFSRSE